MLSELKDEREIMESVGCVCACTHRTFQIVEKKHVTFFKDTEEGQDVEEGRGSECEKAGMENTVE